MTIIAMLPQSSQRIVISTQVVDHMARHRQLSWYSREAGGQLFGWIDAYEVAVVAASGPYRGDQRSRYNYRSNAKSAQQTIDRHGENGLLYLGEWHTHPENHPIASTSDHDAMGRLINASETKSNSLLMLIQGRASGNAGLAIYSADSDGLITWVVIEECATTERIVVSLQ